MYFHYPKNFWPVLFEIFMNKYHLLAVSLYAFMYSLPNERTCQKRSTYASCFSIHTRLECFIIITGYLLPSVYTSVLLTKYLIRVICLPLNYQLFSSCDTFIDRTCDKSTLCDITARKLAIYFHGLVHSADRIYTNYIFVQFFFCLA